MSTPTTPLTCRELVELVNDYVEGAAARARPRPLRGPRRLLRLVRRLRRTSSSETIAVAGQVDPGAIAPDVEAHMLAAFRDWKSGKA